MSKIEEMIRDLCPDGVKRVPLWSLTAWDKHFKGVDKSKQKKVYSYPYLLANDMQALECEGGDVMLLSTGNYVGYTTEELAGDNLCEGEVVTMPWGGTAKGIKYYKGKFVTADNRIATSLDTSVLNNKFFYYWFVNNSEEINSYYRGAGIKHPSMADVLDMQIPLPPLPIQKKIVEILEKFSLLSAELEAELEGRRKQYDFYRNRLLSFDSGSDSVQWKALGDCIHSLKTGLNPRQNFKLNEPGANLPYITGKDIYSNRINVGEKTDRISFEVVKLINRRAQLQVNDVLFASTGTGTVGRMAIVEQYNNEWAVSETMYCLKPNMNIVLPKYIMYILYSENAKSQFEPKISKGSVPHLKVADLLAVKIPVPSLAEQERIVKILDKFEALVSDLSAGLPAEIERVQKQYEYYRNKLLTF